MLILQLSGSVSTLFIIDVESDGECVIKTSDEKNIALSSDSMESFVAITLLLTDLYHGSSPCAVHE